MFVVGVFNVEVGFLLGNDWDYLIFGTINLDEH